MQTSELKVKLEKALDFLKVELGQIRTGRANPSLIEDIKVEAYGSRMSIKELGSIVLLDSQNLAVVPWDKSLLKSISKTIRESDLRLNPVDESDRVRIPIPALTEERRKELVKLVSQKTEEAKNTLRHIRQEAMKDIEKSFTDKEISEDEKFTQKDEVEKLVKDYVEKASQLGETKETDLMTIN